MFWFNWIKVKQFKYINVFNYNLKAFFTKAQETTPKPEPNQNENIDTKTKPEEDIEHYIDDPLFVAKELKEGPVKFEIVGDTSHLFADEDFEKKEVYLLHNNKQSTLTTSSTQAGQEENETKTQSSLPPKNSSNKSNPNCSGFNLTEFRETNQVVLVNGSRLTQLLSESGANDCFLVLFYVPWCPFSAKLAPIYNALPRAFLNLDILAFDVSKSIGYLV